MLHKFKKIIIIGLMIIGVLAIISFGFIFYWVTQTDYKYTGQQLFDEVNKYRTSINAPALELDPILCNNIVERYLDIETPDNGHKGFEEWQIDVRVGTNSKYGRIGEMYVKDISTPQNAINWWLGSPGHKSTLEMKEMIYGCAYANDGTGVVIMAEMNPSIQSSF